MTDPEARGFTLKALREGYVPPPAPVPGPQRPVQPSEPPPAPQLPASPPRLSEPGDGAVITFTKSWGDAVKQPYTYVALNYGGEWALSGGQHERFLRWPGLLEFADRAEAEPPEVHIATSWEPWPQ